MSALQILASELALKIQRREAIHARYDLDALRRDIRLERSELLAAMRRTGATNVYAGSLAFSVVSSMVPVGNSVERRYGLFVRPMTDDEYAAMADADRIDDLRDQADADLAFAAAEGPQYAADFEHALL